MNERLLQIERGGVVHAAQVEDIDDAKLHYSIVVVD
jgi:hypothetical protein